MHRSDIPGSSPDPFAFLAGGGEMGALIRTMDWSSTSLGPVTGWPQSLRTAISICLTSDLPICVIWGPGLVQLYNDAYWVICGDKHPRSMGQNFADCWKEAWPVIGQAHDAALSGDKAVLETQHIYLQRHGYLEECFFKFSFSPVWDEAAQVGGLFHSVTEMTAQMLAQRRTRALRELAAQTSKAKSVTEVFSLSAQALADYPLDLPFMLTYALDPPAGSTDTARLVGAAGLDAGTLASLGTVSLMDAQAVWPLQDVVRSGKALQVGDLGQRIAMAGAGPHPEWLDAALLLPLTPLGADRPVAILVAGISPQLPMNEAYRSFYDLLATTMTAAVISARAHDDERRHRQALAELDHAKTHPLVLAGEALRASEQQYRLLFEQSVDGILLADATGRCVDVNTAGCEMLGYSREEMLARSIPDVLEPDEEPRIDPEIALIAGGQAVRSEWRFRRKDGSVFVGEVTGRQLPDGRVQGLVRDITERKAVEAAIRASDEQVRAILESITDGFFAIDRDWRITYINTAGERFLGRTPGDLIGKVLWEEFPGTVGSDFERVYRRVVARRMAESFTAHYPNFDRWYEVTAYPAPQGLTVYFRDMTEHKLYEERLRLALDAAELGMWNMDWVSRAIRTDARFRAIFGTTEACPDFLQLIAIIHPDDAAAVQAAFTAATRLQDPAPYAIEYRVVHPDGSLRWVSAKGLSSFDGAGATRRVVSFDGTVADITDRKRSDDALIASENRSRSILESITDGFFAIDSDWRFTYMNAAGERSIDCTPGYLIGKCFWDEYPRTVGSEFDRFYRRVAASRVSESLTAHSPDNDRWYEVTAYPAPDGLSVYFRDVTDGRRVEYERQQFAALVEASSDFIGVAGLDQRIVYLNRAGMAMSGLEPEQLASINVRDFFPESERDRIISVITASEGSEDVVVDTWFQHLKTAQLIPVSWSFLRLRDASGNVSGYATVTRDLSERAKAETLLRASEERRRLALDAAELGMWHVDPATRATTTDARFRAIFGTTEEWTDYLQAVAVIHPDDQPAVLEAVAAATRLDDPAPYAIEYRIVLPDGSLRWVAAKGRSAVAGAGPTRRVVSFDGTVADITDQKRREDEREQLVACLRDQDQRKDEFLAILAHELRNPLAPIRNGLQLMKLARNNGDAAEQARSMMERQVGHMVRLIDDLLDLSRISQGKLELMRERIELAVVVRNAVETSQPLIEQMGHTLSIVVPTVPIYLDGDMFRLTQVVSNLLSNSAKYTERGGRIRLHAEQQGSEIVVTVEDNGMGIPTHMLSRVFEMFTQVDRTLEMSKGGMGIGLSLVQRLVELHGGSVLAHSEGQGRGSAIHVRLPVVLSTVAGRQEDSAVPPARSPSRRRILVVDDNREAADSLAELLSMMGHDTQTAYDGAEALEVAAAFEPEVTLLDIGMPKLNGYETCRRMRQQAWGTHMVLYALTGWGQEADQQRSLAAGFDAHLVKPVLADDLEALLFRLNAARN